ncbi:hypothetical protein V8C37DRAFT_68222 [Trichoderma ceciliae]
MTDLDNLKYCFAPNDCTTEDVVAYLDRFSTDTTTRITPVGEAQVADALLKFEFMKSIPVTPGRLPYFSFVSEVEHHAKGHRLKPGLKSFLDMCTTKALDELLSTRGVYDLSFIDEVLKLPTVINSAWQYCLENANRLVKGPASVSLKILTTLLKGRAHVNLAPFRKMRPETMRALLRSLPDARSINLSGTVAITDNEITATLAAIDHDLDALYLLTPPSHHQREERPDVAMEALRNWNHKCCKVLISSALTYESKQGPPWWGGTNGVLYPGLGTDRYFGSSKSFPVIQILYRSTFDLPVLAHLFIGDGFIAPYRLMAGIMKAIEGMHFNYAWNDYNLGTSLVHSLALGPATPDSDEYFDIRAISPEAYFFAQRAESKGEYANPACRMRDLAPDGWTVVILRDEVSTENSSLETGAKEGRTSRFRVVLLRAKYLISVVKHETISVDDFVFKALPAFSRQPYFDEAEDRCVEIMEVDGPIRTKVQLQIGSLDAADAVAVIQEVLEGVSQSGNRGFS